MSRMYLGPVRDSAHAGWLQARFEGDSFSRNDELAEVIDSAIAVYALRELAFHIGNDAIGDAATDALHEALGEDGVHHSSLEHATDWLEEHYSRPVDWLAALKDASDRATKRKARHAAKRAVMQFIERVMA